MLRRFVTHDHHPGAADLGGNTRRHGANVGAATASGCSTASSPSKSPRAAARNASTTARWRARSASGTTAAPAPGGGPGWPAAASPECAPGPPRSGRRAPRSCRAAPTPAARRAPACPAPPAAPSRSPGQQRLPLGVDPVVGLRIGSGRCTPKGCSRRAGAGMQVQAHPGDDRGQPAAEVVDAAGAGGPGAARPAGRRCRRRRASRASGRRPPAGGAVGLEPLRQPVALAIGHILRSDSVITVTNQPRPM
jgi:hypothetical protein